MSLLFNMLSRFFRAFLLRGKRLLILWLQSPSAVILEPKKIKSATVSTVSIYVQHYSSNICGSLLVKNISRSLHARGFTEGLPFRCSWAHGEFSDPKGHMRRDRNPHSLQKGSREGGTHSADGPRFSSMPPPFWVPALTPTCVLSLELYHQDADADSAPSFWTFQQVTHRRPKSVYKWLI